MIRQLIGSSLLALTLGFTACGPMNSKPVAPTTANDLTQCGPVAALTDPTSPQSAISFSKNRSFLFRSEIKSSPPTTANQPQVGDYSYLVHLVHGADFKTPSQTTAVTAQYVRTSAQIQKLHDAQVTRQDDGSYLVNLTLDRPGTWEIRIHANDSDIQDDYVITTSL